MAEALISYVVEDRRVWVGYLEHTDFRKHQAGKETLEMRPINGSVMPKFRLEIDHIICCGFRHGLGFGVTIQMIDGYSNPSIIECRHLK